MSAIKLFCPKCKHKTVHTSYDDFPVERRCPQCDHKYLKEEDMEMKELLERSIGDLKVKLLLYKTALIDAKDPEQQVKLKRFIANTEFEIKLLEREKLLRAAKEERTNVREQKRNSKSK